MKIGDGNLELIDLDQPREGYRQFLSCWVWRVQGRTYLVDPGPGSTIDVLLEELASMGVDRVDCVLLTHIHLDHAGGVGKLLRQYGDARVYCHPAGVKHLVSPGALWRGSVQVLGEVAQMYGEPEPVSPQNLVDADWLAPLGIAVIETPGHAVHHSSFVHGPILFAGEALGTRIPMADGSLYLRPATPPRFFSAQALDSLSRLRSLPVEPALTAYAHYGAMPGAFAYIDAAVNQLRLWVETARQLLAVGPDDLEARLFDRLMELDPLYGQGKYDALDADLQARERHFLKNTLDGIVGDLGI